MQTYNLCSRYVLYVPCSIDLDFISSSAFPITKQMCTHDCYARGFVFNLREVHQGGVNNYHPPNLKLVLSEFLPLWVFLGFSSVPSRSQWHSQFFFEVFFGSQSIPPVFSMTFSNSPHCKWRFPGTSLKTRGDSSLNSLRTSTISTNGYSLQFGCTSGALGLVGLFISQSSHWRRRRIETQKEKLILETLARYFVVPGESSDSTFQCSIITMLSDVEGLLR